MRDFTADEQALAQHLGNQIGVAIRLLDQRSVQEQLFRTEKMAAVGRLISGVVNELQTPLASITSLANKALDKAHGGPAEREVSAIAAEATKAAGMVSRLISYAAAEQVDARPVDVSGLLRSLIEFREGDAEQLPFTDGLFDAAVMNFGILHLERPDQALAEAFRVLHAGGRFGFTVWAKPEEAVGFGIVLRSIAKHGDSNVALPEGPPFFRFSEPAECVRALLAAGFESPKVVKVPQVWRLPSVDSLFKFMRESTVRTAGLLRAQKPEVLEKIREAMRQELEQYQKGKAVELPMPAILASAIKP